MVFCDQTTKYVVSCNNSTVYRTGGLTASHSLAAVNFCLFLVGTTQVSRILLYQRSVSGSTEGAVKELAGDVEARAKKLEKKAESEMA